MANKGTLQRNLLFHGKGNRNEFDIVGKTVRN